MKTHGYKKDWFKEWFDELYITVYSHRDQEDANRLIDLLTSRLQFTIDDIILDAACGSGRHAQLLAEKGLHVVGFDLSEALLKEAHYNKNSSTYPVLVRNDMRYLPFKLRFTKILSLFTSFGYFEDGENIDVLQGYFDVLKPGGIFVLDYLNADRVVQKIIPKTEKIVKDAKITEHRQIRNDRVNKRIIIERDGYIREYTESVKLYSLHVMYEMLEGVGFKIENVYGSYSGAEYQKNSERMIFVSQKSLSG